jgi:protein TonB
MEHHFEYKTASRARERLRTALVVLVSAALLVAAFLGVRQLLKEAGGPKRRQVQPERPKEEVKQEIKTPEPDKAKDDAPPSPDLGLDAEGAAGGDSFGLVGRPGGRDITTIGGAGGSGGGIGRINTALYASQLQSQLQDELNRNERLRAAEYRALVKLWVNADGKIARVELAGSTGDAELDRRLQGALEEARKLRPPPEGVAQPIKLELVARRT